MNLYLYSPLTAIFYSIWYVVTWRWLFKVEIYLLYTVYTDWKLYLIITDRCCCLPYYFLLPKGKSLGTRAGDKNQSGTWPWPLKSRLLIVTLGITLKRGRGHIESEVLRRPTILHSVYILYIIPNSLKGCYFPDSIRINNFYKIFPLYQWWIHVTVQLQMSTISSFLYN